MAAVALVGNNFQRFFGRINDRVVCHAALFELNAHHAAERADAGFGDIRHLKPRRVELVARPHRADGIYARLLRPADQRQLRLYRVDAVRDCVKLRQVERLGALRRVKHAQRHNLAGRVDVLHLLGNHFDLWPADGGIHRDGLTVDV